MATFIDLLLSISVALLILTVAFGIFIRAHERTYPSNKCVRHWGLGRNQ